MHFKNLRLAANWFFHLCSAFEWAKKLATLDLDQKGKRNKKQEKTSLRFSDENGRVDMISNSVEDKKYDNLRKSLSL